MRERRHACGSSMCRGQVEGVKRWRESLAIAIGGCHASCGRACGHTAHSSYQTLLRLGSFDFSLEIRQWRSSTGKAKHHDRIPILKLLGTLL
jgi:hypothetical protein